MAANQARELLRSAGPDGIPALSPTEAPAWPQRPAAQGLRPGFQDCWLPPSQSWLSCVRPEAVLPPKGPLCPPSQPPHQTSPRACPSCPPILPGEETQEAAPFGSQSEVSP